MRILLAVLVVCLLSPAVVRAEEKKLAADSCCGIWHFPKKNGKMEIYREGDKFFGKVISYEDPESLDKNNPDPKLQTRKFIGIQMLHDFDYDADSGKWTNGKIYDGDSGKTYKCTMWFEDGDLNKLNARGYIGVALLGRTEIFTRTTADAPDAITKKKEDKTAKK